MRVVAARIPNNNTKHHENMVDIEMGLVHDVNQMFLVPVLASPSTCMYASDIYLNIPRRRDQHGHDATTQHEQDQHQAESRCQLPPMMTR
jgi:hypothetical protein